MARINTKASSEPLASNPFGGLGDLESRLPVRPPLSSGEAVSGPVTKKKPAMRLEVRREKSGRGGKTVTTIGGVASLDQKRRVALLRDLKTRCGTGGTDRGTSIEIQGDQRETVMEFLRGAGFRPVLAGG